MDRSKIEWCDATWNIFSGCTSVSDGCTNCFARGIAQWQPSSHQVGKDFSEVVFHKDRLDVPLRWRKPRKIFVNSMSDIFHEQAVHDHPSWIAAVFAAAALAPRHTFMLLTKRPHLAVKWFEDYLRNDPAGVMSLAFERYYGTTEPDASGMIHNAVEKHWPLPNVWLGATVESDKYAFRIDDLGKCPAVVRYVSHGPALGSIFWSKNRLDAIDWLITEGETGRNARPMHPVWATNDRDMCRIFGKPFFFKQWGAWAPSWGGGDHLVYPDGRVVKGWHEDTDAWKEQKAEPMKRMKKKDAGRLLEGQEYSEFPEIR
jgi:protein gp37